jgi:hypothetical protein
LSEAFNVSLSAPVRLCAADWLAGPFIIATLISCADANLSNMYSA